MLPALRTLPKGASFAGHYDDCEPIGKGGYGAVFKCRDKVTGQYVAVKSFYQKQKDIIGMCPTVLREIDALQALPPHRNVVRLLGVLHNPSDATVDIVLEYVGTTTLNRFMNAQPLRPDLVKDIAKQLLEGVSHIHGHGLLHRDIKPPNVIMRQADRAIVLCDFGSSRVDPSKDEDLTTGVMTLWYRAPEILLGNSRYDNKVDMWSVGCIIGETMCGHPLFPGECDSDQLLRVCQVVGSPPVTPDTVMFPAWGPKPLEEVYPRLRYYGRDAVALLSALLVQDPAVRLDARTALQHAYFTSS